MTPDRTRHLVESVLADQGWAVYRLVLGGGPALAVTRAGSDPLMVAVARASEPRGGTGPYPRLERAEGAHALASVTGEGVVTFHDPLTRSEAPRLADLLLGRPVAVRPLHAVPHAGNGVA